MLKGLIAAVVLCSASVFPAFSQAVYADKPDACRPTPAIPTSHYPGFKAVPSSNKLALPAGKAELASGTPVYLQARVFDRNCVPVLGAKVELWQTNPSGRHRFATSAALATPDAVFTGAGRATSDNMGQFSFLTLYPGGYRYTITRKDKSRVTLHRAPHFNVAISHSRLKNFRTNLFFEGEPENGKDHHLKQLSEAAKPRVMMNMTPRSNDPNAGLIAQIDIILPDRVPFRTY